MNVQQSLVRLFNSRWQDCSNLTGTIDQQSLALFFNSYRYNSSTVTGTIVQQSLPWLLKSHWHDYSTVAGIVFQQLQARMFNRHWHDCLAVTGKIFSFLYWQNFSSVIFTVEESCHVPGIQYMIQIRSNTFWYMYILYELKNCKHSWFEHQT